MKWSQNEALEFSVPFPDQRADICLDALLPRVNFLALHSTVRKTRVAAAECLHVLATFVIGKQSSQTAEMRQKRSLEPIFSRLFPSMLTLACDRDTVIKDLFHPLFNQSIHWFTRNTKDEAPETAVLLDTIVEGLCCKRNTSVRQGSAVFLKEFLVWSIKQTPKNEMAKRAHNPKALFKRLGTMWLHPDPIKRLGASLAFNKLYRTFREEEALVTMLAMEIFVYVTKSLSLGKPWEEDFGAAEEAAKTVDHLLRILCKPKFKFDQEDPRRGSPRELKGGNSTLELIAWLFGVALKTDSDKARASPYAATMVPINEFTTSLARVPYPTSGPKK